MARTALTRQVPPGNIDYDGAGLTWEATDDVNDNDVEFVEGMFVLFRNDDVGALTAVVVSSADNLARTRDASKSVAASAYAVFGPFLSQGWKQSDGKLYIDSTSANLKVAVLSPLK